MRAFRLDPIGSSLMLGFVVSAFWSARDPDSMARRFMIGFLIAFLIRHAIAAIRWS